jgi:diaminohydroxyphosphoribosylaminopyrimidine deaminase / 5-amino-6-(5-phosphoribosylamino)uracil reductase
MSTSQSKNNTHTYFMNLALEQAKKMLGNTKENPSVGCVITKNNQVVGAGTTGFNGRPHAEYNALKLNKFKKCNLYVTLEPCTHYGKTPPCVNNIKKNKIKKVFFSIYDPDLRTHRKSHVYFKKNEIKVKTKILHKKINEFYKSYSKSKLNKLPYVTSKIAISKDFYTIDKNKRWITNNFSRGRGHLLRSTHDSILTSSKTVIEDDPKLTCRINGLEHTTPTRIVLDKKMKIPIKSNILKNVSKYPTIIFYNKALPQKTKKLIKMNIKLFKISLDKDNQLDLKKVLIKLKSLGFFRILLEAGSTLNTSFLKKDLIDDFKLFISNKSLNIKGYGSFKSDYYLFLKKKKKINEKVNLFGDKMITVKLK